MNRLSSSKNLQTQVKTDEGVVQAVDGVSLDISSGEILGLVGESGAGKSATARSVLRLIDSPGEIVGGEVLFNDEDVLSMSSDRLREYRGSDMGMVFQDPTSTLNPTMEIGKQVQESVENAKSVSGEVARAKAIELLKQVGIPNAAKRADDYPHEFSGGQKQRIVIAIAIAGGPDLLVADEPTTGLDVTIQSQILDLLRDLNKDLDMSVLFITHDLGVVRELCDRVAIMYAGSIVETGPVAPMFTHPNHPYTKGLVRSIPRIGDIEADSSDQLPLIEGTMPNLTEEFEGCKYADRCPAATEECLESHPPLEATTDRERHVACYHYEDTASIEYDTEVDRGTISWEKTNNHGNDETILEVSDLKKYFDTSTLFDQLFGNPSSIRAVDDISFSIGENETFGIVGESGCGKSTLARSILRLLEPTDGEVVYQGNSIMTIDNEELRELRRELQIVFQDPQSSLNPLRTIRRTIEHPMKLHNIGTEAERPERISELIEAVGLETRHLDRYPHELSGGQQQRVGIARALAVNPEVIVLDEPVSGLDVSVQAQILNLLKDIQEDLGIVYILISHDLSVVSHLCNRVAVMYLGELVDVGPTEKVFDPPFHPYTQVLRSSIPGEEMVSERNKELLQGEVPDPSNIPSGCRFHPRCPHKIGEVCEHEAPADHIVGGEQISCHLMREEYADKVDWEKSLN